MSVRVAFTILLLGTYQQLQATAQIGDVLIYKSDSFKLYTNPLEIYFELTGQRELPDFIGCGSTNCWRGYQAIWQIKDGQLFLLSIRSCNRQCGLEVNDANLGKMFGARYVDGKVLADWYSGILVAPYGRIIRYVHMGYVSAYEKQHNIEISSGNVTKEDDFTNYIDDPEKLDRFSHYDPLFKIYKTVKRKMKWRRLPDDGRYWWEDFLVTIGADGRIKSVENTETDSDPAYAQAVFDSIKELGPWDIIQSNGQPIEEQFLLELEFDFLFHRISDMNIQFSMKEQKKIRRRT